MPWTCCAVYLRLFIIALKSQANVSFSISSNFCTLWGLWHEILAGVKCTGLVGVLPGTHGAFLDAVVNAMIAQQNEPSVVQLALIVLVFGKWSPCMFAKFAELVFVMGKLNGPCKTPVALRFKRVGDNSQVSHQPTFPIQNAGPSEHLTQQTPFPTRTI